MSCSWMSWLAVVDAVEHLAHRDRRRRVLADEAEALLQLGGHGVFHPEQVIGLERPAEASRFDGRQAVVDVVQQVRLRPELLAQAREERRHERRGTSRCSSTFSGGRPGSAGS